MATRRWLDVDGDWTNVANWSGGAAPAGVAADSAVIDSGSQNITLNVDQNAVELLSIKVGPNFTGNIGGTGNPLKIGSAETWIAGGGEVWLEGKTLVDLPVVHMDKGGREDNALVLAGFIGEVNVIRGHCEIAANFNTDETLNFRCLHRTNIASDAHLIIGSGGTVAELVVVGGHVETTSAVTSLYLSAGSIRTLLGVITTARIFGGTLYWECDENLGTVWVYGGKLDATRNYDSVTSPTINTLHQFAGAVVDLQNGIGNITAPSGASLQLYGSGGPLQDVGI